VRSELSFIGPRRFWWWPVSVMRSALKLLAYELSQQQKNLPRPVKKWLGMHKPYWDNPYAGLHFVQRRPGGMRPEQD
jgi:rhamnosyltransferase